MHFNIFHEELCILKEDSYVPKGCKAQQQGTDMIPGLRKLLVGLTLCSMSLSSFANEQLRVAFNPSAPWKTFNSQEKAEGVYAEIAKVLAKQLSLQPVFVPCPLERCLLLLNDGEADLMLGLSDSVSRREYLHFLSTPYRTSAAKVFYVRKDREFKILRYEDLANRTVIGTKAGALYFERFDNDDELIKSPVLDNQQNFGRLHKGRIDTFIIAQDQGEFLLSRLDLRDKIEQASFKVAERQPRYVALAKSSPLFARVEEFEQAVKALVQDGQLKDILRREFYQRYDIPEDSFTWN
ncbi:transporter substrate-binding domain-containing protein [Aliiglaciecola sp. CAU 1673]|uniref:substrate-binding periplasmic protein n=1 Tax=Aliiglaciecola sp. CAU 1673 TaxID=3032595 RepID=UPI0023DB72B3|nr:transporter substrate-binding domain-containing protein [Aliiglaciecola sp. CAU 1673]MDF2177034.1 transporter substrate-binding domain-containing protein [Aliiglaciecola sp. CAU 1673]